MFTGSFKGYLPRCIMKSSVFRLVATGESQNASNRKVGALLERFLAVRVSFRGGIQGEKECERSLYSRLRWLLFPPPRSFPFAPMRWD